MNTIDLEPKFFTGGNCTFTVDNGAGTHYTFKIRKPKVDSPFFVSLLTGPCNETSFTYLGIMDLFGSVRLTAKSKMNDTSAPVKVVRWALKHAFGDRQLPDGYKVTHAGKCGCCGRKLTEPLSLERGIGPECWSRMV